MFLPVSSKPFICICICCFVRWMQNRAAEGVLRGPAGAIGNEPREGHQSGSGNCPHIIHNKYIESGCCCYFSTQNRVMWFSWAIGHIALAGQIPLGASY